MSNSGSKIFIAGHTGMVGSAILRRLKNAGVENDQFILEPSSSLDLREQTSVRQFFDKANPTAVYLAAARVGGILANKKYPAKFIYDNLMIQSNVIHACYEFGVSRLLFIGSSCIYPKLCKQPIEETALLTGALEETNEAYAIAKIAGLKMCEFYNIQFGEESGIDFRSVMPTNLYGIGDNYHPENSHVIPGLIHRFHEAKLNELDSVTVWGSGEPLREFLFVDDLADACVHIMSLEKDLYKELVGIRNMHINVGSGIEVNIRELAETVAKTVGYRGKIYFDRSKPDGTPRKLLSLKKIQSLGWSATTSLDVGLEIAYTDFQKELANG